ncbi:exodeoxyribonuclease V subunit beta [Salinibius halmophilus]|uniref:exodeoxyribonuclease V subunit beta n=1 Tax=Salinibius halmophilus TaxID=1853216 RepID=UPI001314071E|nr:exodeoxyribonuclease V subunit beta [Salinibius halmophilus]
MSNVLEPLQFPLHASRLIEASAGTGKTFTLAALYVRLVLGHGDEDSRPVRALMPNEILVLTFTKAATAELRDRIRARLVEAAQVFRGLTPPQDPILTALVGDYAPELHSRCATQLDLAAQSMDDSAIYTIHSWCQRMLSEHAFDAGASFGETIANSDDELLQNLARDYWRCQFYPLPSDLLPEFLSVAKSPDDLLAKCKALVNVQPGSVMHISGEALPKAASPTELLPQIEKWRGELETALAGMDELVEEALSQLDQAFSEKTLHGNKFRESTWLSKERDLLAGWTEQLPKAKDLNALAAKYNQDNLSANTKKGKTPPTSDFFNKLDTLAEVMAKQPDISWQVVNHASQWLSQQLAKRKRQLAQMSFDDMLTRLNNALDSTQKGEQAKALAARIRQQYPVAMIDEFQDTDPTQFAIFNRVYQDIHQSREQALVLVGDPKQAIYSFRGADLHTYLSAREQTQGRHYNLGTNFRSTQAMVGSVNALFERGESNLADGAFGFKTETDNALPFLPVHANGKTQHFDMPEPVAAMNYWPIEDVGNKSDYDARMTTACADQIQQCLQHGQLVDDEAAQPITAKDIAVLVRNRTEAEQIKTALAERGIDSVYLSERQSVFSSDEAKLIYHWLHAIHLGDNESLLRAGLALPLMMLNEAQLAQYLDDDLRWERLAEQVKHWQWLWRKLGVLAMLRNWLHYFELSSLWPERSLTNFLHLAELLQQQSQLQDGEAGLVRWLADAISEGVQNDDNQLRLESDEQLVQIVTWHKAKGLQYSLVFLPYVMNYKLLTKSHTVSYHQDGELIVDVSPDEQALAQAQAERLQEEVRLLYVALTRPVYACWLGLAAFTVGKKKKTELQHSGLGHLLGLNTGDDAAALSQAVAGLGWKQVSWPAGAPPLTKQRPKVAASQALPMPSPRERWWIASYSALETGALRTPIAAPDTAQEATWLEEEISVQDSEQQLSMDDFPRGAVAGTALHDMLEWRITHRRSPESEWQHYCKEQLARRGWSEWLPVLDVWRQQMLTTPMTVDHQSSLENLPQAVAEMEFWLAANQVSAPELDDIIAKHIWPQLARPRLQPDQLNGMLKGFIDLTLQDAKGRYWVCDYKSNWLGSDEQAYSQAAMQKAMLDKRYDVQAALYMLALYRLLKARQPEFSAKPEAYIGGGHYWFIRQPQAGQILLPANLEMLKELDALFSGGHH